ATNNIVYEDLSIDELKIINFLNSRGKILLDDLKKEINISGISRLLNKLEDKGFIETTIDIRTTIEKKYEKWLKIVNHEKSLVDILDTLGKRATKQREIIQFLYE